MCFYKKHHLYRVSEEDITCYKIMISKGNGHYRSLYKNYPYSIGETYHSKRFSLGQLNGENMLFGGVFHSYSTIQSLRASLVFVRPVPNTCVVECVIPAGTKYWENDDYEEYASRSIKIIKELYKEDHTPLSLKLYC